MLLRHANTIPASTAPSGCAVASTPYPCTPTPRTLSATIGSMVRADEKNVARKSMSIVFQIRRVR